ncbi:MAG: hypothetical protein ABIT61_09565 [Steroidobacteraceae bacterium]
MNSLMHDYPEALLAEHVPPCVSLYLPTHRSHPDNAQDPIRFGTLLKQAEKHLREKYPSNDIASLLQPFKNLADDRMFWNHTGDGLAVLGGPEWFRVFRLQRPVTELCIVADSFHTKPLMRIVQSADSYQVLGLHQQAFKIYEGNRDGIQELPPIAGVPQTAAELLNEDADKPDRAKRVYGTARASTQHGIDMKQDAEKRNTERFFRAVDQAVLQHHSNPSGLPLILAALPEHHHLFRSVSRNPQLMDGAIDVYPDDIAPAALRERAWKLVLPKYLAQLNSHLDAFGGARGSGLGADALDEIATAALAGRIATLLIEADRLIPGNIDTSSGKISTGKSHDPSDGDILDDLGKFVLKNGGKVVIVPAAKMPTQTGAAAIFRF